MHRDLHGLDLSTSSAAAAQAFDRTIESFLKYRVDASEHLKQMLVADGDFALGHTLKGYFAMLAFKQATVPRAAEAAKTARALAASATARERAHIEALDSWISGDVPRTVSLWEEILAEHPHDVLAFRLAHFNTFWLGRPKQMRAAVDRVMPRWSRDLPAYGTMLSCRCFAYEESGDYSAEADGRKAVEIDPADLWATHAVAHVMEMQGRQAEGIEWLAKLEKNWAQANNVAHHLWWHRAMYHLERREFGDVLSLYDNRFRNLKSPLIEAVPDLYIDIQNAASMLFRLERQGVDVGKRWDEIADKEEARIGDCRSAFTLPHWIMALAAAGRHDPARRMLEGMRDFAKGKDPSAELIGRVALPICEAALKHRQKEFAGALDAMRPVLGEMRLLGGSHAQQDVLEQLFLDCAVKADRPDDVWLVLRQVAGKFPTPPARRIGYAEAASKYGG